MRRHGGFTLVEVIVAVGFVALLVTIIMSTTANQYNAIKTSKVISEQNAKLMDGLENKYKRTKTDLEDGIVLENPITISLFSGDNACDVVYYKVAEEAEDKVLLTYASDTRIPGLSLSSVSEGEIKAYTNNSNQHLNVSYAYLSSDLILKSKFTIIDPENIHFKTKYEWYVSRSGFNIANYGNDVGDGKKPVFPDDYVLIVGENTPDIDHLREEYRGKFLVVAATPITNFGKMGNRRTSLNEFYVLGLPDVSDAEAKIHLDASIINLNPNSVAKPNNEVIINEEIMTVKKWLNLSNPSNVATQANSINDPTVKIWPIGYFEYNRTQKQAFVSYVNMIRGKNLTLPYNNLNATGETTIFAVVRSDTMGHPIMKQKSSDNQDVWGIGLDKITLGEGIEKTIVDTEIQKWQVIGFGVQILPGDVDTRIVVSVNGTLIVDDIELNYMNPLSNSGVITLGGEGSADIAELIVYDGFLNDEDYKKVEDYLRAKYFKRAVDN